MANVTHACIRKLVGIIPLDTFLCPREGSVGVDYCSSSLCCCVGRRGSGMESVYFRSIMSTD